jgi:hypothetical protein
MYRHATEGELLGGIANLACTTTKSSLTLNPLSPITWSFGSNRDTNKGNNKITELRAILQRESQNS